MVTKPDIIRTIKKFAMEIKNNGVNLKKVYLFGSYSNNTQKEHSDIDVALVADEFTGVGYIDIKLFVAVANVDIQWQQADDTLSVWTNIAGATTKYII